MSISFKFKYKGKLAGEPNEISPVLFWWSSTIRSFENGVNRIPIEWEDEEKQISKDQTISIPIRPSSNGKYRLDDQIWIECIVQSPNEERFYVGSRAGSANIWLKNIYDNVNDLGNFNKKLNLLMPQMKDSHGNPFTKGKIKLDLLTTKNDIIKQNWEFENQGPYDLTKENEKNIEKIFNMNIVSSLFPYTDTASKQGLQFNASVDFIEAIHAPVWVSSIDVPGWAYWVNYSKYEPDELFWENLAKVALDRNSVSREWFLKIATSQLEKMSEEYDENFNTIVSITMEACTIPSISLHYKSDESYSVQVKKGFFKKSGITINKRSIESFNDALTMLGDDCEGLGALIHRVMHILKTGIPSRKGNQPWNKYGGWKDPVLQQMQHLVYWYVSVGSLGSVTAARVGGASAKNHPLIIDSSEDKNAQLGAHMWQESISVYQFQELMKIINKANESFKLREASYPKWLNRLPHTIGEGTGSVHPFLRPIGEYYKDSEALRKTAINSIDKKLESMKLIIEKGTYLRMGQIQKFQKMIENEPDARYSNFYRRTTSIFTDEFFKEGFLTGEFVWVQTSPRVSEKYDDDGGDYPWTWGANMRDKLNFLKREGKKLGLLTVPPITIEEKQTILSLLRQLPPLQTPTLSQKRKEDLENYAQPKILKFQSKVDAITKERKLVDKNNSSVINIIFRRSEFFSKINEIPLRKRLLDDIKEIEQIYKIKTVFEPITNQIYNVRLQVYINNSSNNNNSIRSIESPIIKRNLFSVNIEWNVNGNSFEEIYHFKEQKLRFAFCQGILQHNDIDIDFFAKKDPKELKMYSRGLSIIKERKKLGFKIENIDLEQSVEDYLEFEV